MAEEDKGRQKRKEPAPYGPPRHRGKRKRNPDAKAVERESYRRYDRMWWRKGRDDGYPTFFQKLACRHCTCPFGAHNKASSTAPLKLVCGRCSYGYRRDLGNFGGHHEFEPEIPLRVTGRKGKLVTRTREHRGTVHTYEDREDLPDVVITTRGWVEVKR